MKVLAVILFAAVVSAQVQQGGSPVDASLLAGGDVDTKVMPRFDEEAFAARAAAEPKDVEGGALFAQQFPVEYSLENSGTWTSLADGTKVWRLAITSQGAATINLFFSQYELYPGNALFVYSADRSTVRGAFTEANNKANGQMAIAPIRGDAIVLELSVAAGAEVPRLEIGAVNHQTEKNYCSSGNCNINAVCSYADAFRDEVDGVAMIITAGGSRWCSGSLINNVANQDRQLFLTANHCLSNPDNFVIVFNYQSPVCDQADQSDGSLNDSVQGTSTIANGLLSDYALLELSETIPASYDLYYAGFSATNDTDIPFAIHHPAGDIKKLAYSNDEYVSSQWSGANSDTHWLVEEWHGPGQGNQDQGDRTTTEGGSSGSPLYDTARRIVGQLHGGQATCNYPYVDLYGKVSVSWDDSAAFRGALDPQNTGNRVAEGRRQ